MLSEYANSLRDFNVQAGNPDRRTELATSLQEWGFSPTDVETVGRYFEAVTHPTSVGGALYRVCQSKEAFQEALEMAKRRASKISTTEPGQRERQENMAHEDSVAQRDLYRVQLAAYQMIAHQEVASKEALVRRLVQHFPMMKEGYLLANIKPILQEGASLYGHPCPPLAAHLLSRGDAKSNNLWLMWRRQGKLRSSHTEAIATAADEVRETYGWEVDKDAKVAPAPRKRIRLLAPPEEGHSGNGSPRQPGGGR